LVLDAEQDEGRDGDLAKAPGLTPDTILIHFCLPAFDLRSCGGRDVDVVTTAAVDRDLSDMCRSWI